jgi:large subunit ribosomal protein L21
MYAVFEQGAKQYKVAEGDSLNVDLVDIDPQAKEISFEKVLFIGDGPDVKIGKPYVEGAKVIASFENTAEEAVVKGPKLYPTTFRRRKNSRKRIGHRQKSLAITIAKIEA